ncbi:hypothetical protein AAMO2058_001494600 [Amorphochlora amoebiformis]
MQACNFNYFDASSALVHTDSRKAIFGSMEVDTKNLWTSPNKSLSKREVNSGIESESSAIGGDRKVKGLAEMFGVHDEVARRVFEEIAERDENKAVDLLSNRAFMDDLKMAVNIPLQNPPSATKVAEKNKRNSKNIGSDPQNNVPGVPAKRKKESIISAIQSFFSLQKKSRLQDPKLYSRANNPLHSEEKDIRSYHRPEETVTRLAQSKLSEYNPLIHLVFFMSNVMRDINSKCLVCSTPLKFVGRKPGVCDSKLCQFGQDNLSLAFSLGSELKAYPDVCDLLICMAYTAAHQHMWDFAMPTGVSGVTSSGRKMDLVREGKVNYPLLLEVLNACPKLKDMVSIYEKLGTAGLSHHLKVCHYMLEPLLRWIITSNRAHFRRLKKDEMIPDVSDIQFVMLGASPQHEQKFQLAKIQNYKTPSTVWAWHGSSMCNWHSIVRTSLKNMSGTKYMRHGAAHGKGIYLATNIVTSMGFTKNSTPIWQKSRFAGGRTHIVALCEIVNHPTLREPKPHYVVPEETWVVTRFLMLVKGTPKCTSAKKAGSAIPEKLKLALQTRLKKTS